MCASDMGVSNVQEVCLVAKLFHPCNTRQEPWGVSTGASMAKGLKVLQHGWLDWDFGGLHPASPFTGSVTLSKLPELSTP